MKIPQKLKNVLIVMDPLPKLDLAWDNSLALARTFAAWGSCVWSADAPDLRLQNGRLLVRAQRLRPLPGNAFRQSPPAEHPVERFDLVVLRKEPPFDIEYFYLTFLLEKAGAKVPVANDPRGVRNANEKLWGLLHTRRVPDTLISRSVQDLLRFYRALRGPMIVKALHEKGGRGIELIPARSRHAEKILQTATGGGNRSVACQKFIRTRRGADKRIVLLDGKILCAFEKHPAAGEFRSNLSLGGSAHPTVLTRRERELVRALAPVLKREGLYLAGLDVMGEKLLEVNVTSPAGMTDAEAVYGGGGFTDAWAAWLSQWAISGHRARRRPLPF